MALHWSNPQDGIIIFLLVLLVIALSNLWAFRKPRFSCEPSRWPEVAVLIPARNEAANLPYCLESLRTQDYPGAFEVWVLDDDSTDATGALAAQFAARDERFHYLRGTPLPEGWLGKHWACQQLAETASAEILLFLDADTWLAPNALRTAVATFEAKRIDLLSLVPYEVMQTWGERLIQPFFLWAMMAFYPLGLAFHLRWPALSFTIGQFMLMRRQVYFTIGGHAAIRDDVVDDMALGRRTIAAGYRWRLMDGGELVRCRMYHSWQEAFQGFSKNLFGVFSYRVLPFLFVMGWLGWVFLQPWCVMTTHLLGIFSETDPQKALFAILLSFLLFGVAYLRLRIPLYLTLFYPITVGISLIIGLYSLWLTLQGASTWRGRRLVRPRIRWL
ncbi:glycosyltransferase [uncultured Thermanaerothrix sp.]|uniref:glycosyltransferase n=1 Tax=uncultured Thermanaerothrix sp. TaxID=1195149 RepID=UPI002624FBEA|nr:glycosyltransferase [uncultured Thermanaerothrix sp.]